MLWKFHSRLSKMRFSSRWCYTRACNLVTPRIFEVNPEVKECIQKGNPVVALESTIITHGMPYPQNLATAIKVEEVVRKNGAVPATVGVIEGKIHIGMDRHKLENLASRQKEVVKISKRDLPFVLSKKLSGGTTVAATMVLANKAGIDIFVTGGVGGVHRDGENSMDVSADLIQLSETPMTVISAGVKSILDIGRTLEFLETQGVCVATYGKTKDFPSFFTPASGFQAPYNVETVEEAAHMILCRDELSLGSAILLAVPIPADQAADGVKTERAIEQALEEARLKNVVGKEVTPFILSRVQEISGGASLKANIALIENNALVGSQIAVELSKLKAKKRQKDELCEQGNNRASVKNFASRYVASHEKGFPKQAFISQAVTQNSLSPRPVVIGGTVLDLTVTSHQKTIQKKFWNAFHLYKKIPERRSGAFRPEYTTEEDGKGKKKCA